MPNRRMIFPSDVSFLWLTLQNERADEVEESEMRDLYQRSFIVRHIEPTSAVRRSYRNDVKLTKSFPLYDATYATAMRYKNALIDSYVLYVLYSKSIERLARIVTKHDEIDATLRLLRNATEALQNTNTSAKTCNEV